MSTYKEQAEEILYREGGCPQITNNGCNCETCLYFKYTGRVNGCNPSTTKIVAKLYITNGCLPIDKNKNND